MPISHKKFCRYLNWKHIALAMVDVFRENKRLEDLGKSDYKANADTWSIYSSLRKHLLARARHFWCERTGEDPSMFPYSEDAIARLYFRFRKRNDSEILEFIRSFDDSDKGKEPSLFD